MADELGIAEIKTTNKPEEANGLLSEGWDLFSVVANPTTLQTHVQEERGIKPYDFIMVRYGLTPTPRP